MPAPTGRPIDGIAVDHLAGVTTITINRPERRNALDRPARVQLGRILADISEDDEAHVVVLTGAGGGFSSRTDLDALANADSRAVLLGEYLPIIRSIRGMPKPVIAAVAGVASGAGASLALVCDLLVAGRTARFDLSFLRLGLVPDAGLTWHLVRAAGRHRAAELIWSGGSADALTLHAWGLVNRLVEPGRELAEAQDWAQELTGASRPAIAASKRLIADALTDDLWRSVADEADAQRSMRATPRHRDAMAARATRSARPVPVPGGDAEP